MRSLVILGLTAIACLPLRSALPGYVDPAVCAVCHREAAAGYARSGMARTFGATLASEIPTGRFHHARSAQDYTVSRRGDKFYLRRSTTGYDGKPADLLETEMTHWIGSGNHARSYLSRGAGGKLVELPLTWYSAAGGHWAMSPGYDLPFHAGFSRKITYGCLFCHAGYPDLPPTADPSDAGWRLPAQLPTGIDCQRCHGPGQAHVAAANGQQPPDRVRRAIVNPRKLDPQRGMEVCLQCHLETTSLRLPGFLRNYDRATFSYRPGEPLQDYILHFDRAAFNGRNHEVEFVGEAYRLRLSACFRESKGALTCMTCHNPHDIPRGEAAARRYAGICQGCHRAAVAKLVQAGSHPPSLNCIACHMPRRQPVDAVNTTVADHFIRKRPAPEPDGTPIERNDATAPAYRGEVVLYYPPAAPRSPDSDLYLAVSQVKHGASLAAGLPRLESLIRGLQPANGNFYLDLSDAFRQAGQPADAIPCARQASEQMPANWRAWFALGGALIASGDPAQAIDPLRRALALAPDEPSVAQLLGEAYGRQGKFTEALAAFRSAIAADPDFAEGHNNTGTTLLRLGDKTGAEKELREAVRLRPESSAMQTNLAAFLAGRGALPEARTRFELALKLNPDYAEGHSAYGSALAANREWTSARRQLEIATTLNPKAPIPHHNLAVVLLELNDSAAAQFQLETAIALNPDYSEARQKLGMLLIRQGRRAEGETQLRKAAETSTRK